MSNYSVEDLRDNLIYLNETKEIIKSAIINKGQNISSDTPFREYANKISNINSGTDTSDATATANDIISGKTVYARNAKLTGNIYVQSDTTSSGIEVLSVTAGAATPKIFSINDEYNIAFGTLTQDTTIGVAYDFTDDELGEELDRFTITGGNRIHAVKCSQVLNGNGNLNVMFINRDGGYVAQCLEFDVVNKEFLTDTLATYSGGPWWHYSLHANPANPANFIVANRDNAGSFIRSLTYLNGTLSATAYQELSGGNPEIAEVHFNELGTYMLVKINTTMNVYTVGSNGAIARVINVTNSTPCIWRNYYFNGSSLYNISNQTLVKDFSDNFTITTSDWVYTYKDFLVLIKNYSTNPKLNIYYLDPVNITARLLVQNMGIVFSPTSNWGGRDYQILSNTPYYPKSNSTEYLLNFSTNTGYKLNLLGEQQIPQKITYKNTDLVNTSDASAVEANLLYGKTAFNAEGQMTGTMPNNGALNYTPSTSQQSIPAGYTSGGTISAVTSAIEPNLLAKNIVYRKSIFGVNGSAINNTAEVCKNVVGVDGATNVDIKLKDASGVELVPSNNVYSITTRPTTIEVYQHDTKVDETTYNIVKDGMLKVEVSDYLASADDNYSNSQLALVNNGINPSIRTQTGTLYFATKDGDTVLYTDTSSYIGYDFDTLSEYTIEFEFYKDGTASYPRLIGVLGANYEIEIKGSSNNIYWGGDFAAGWRQNAWNKLKLVKESASSGNVKLYINDSLITTKTYSNSLTGINIGAGTSSGNYFAGWIRNLRVFTTKTPATPLSVTFKEGLEYTELEYIQTSGTQYINTGYIYNNNCRFVFRGSNFNAAGALICCSDVLASNGISCSVDNNNLYWNYLQDNALISSVNNSTKHTLNIYRNTVVVDNNVILTNASVNTSVTFMEIRLFANRDLSSYGYLKLYYFRIYDSDVLVRDFIPVKDKNGVVCLYDKVSKMYFYNEGTGSFIAGPEV